ncbi:MAG TPA: ATP cone domain-containing protein [Ignavibacteriaceae bacterium]|nr:ATP cone domain-containing protein [Ignavibacteriaceae bacterium]
MSKVTHVIKRTGAVVPFNKNRITNAIYRAAVAVGGRDKDKAEMLAEQVVELLEEKCPEGCTPSIEEIQDLVEFVLIKNGHDQVSKEYILYRNERNRKRESENKYASIPNENIPWAKIWRVLDWAVSHNLHTTEAYNDRVRKGEFPQIVHESESRYEGDINVAANLILERAKDLKMVFISGPSSSGKTTTTIKVEQRLNKSGLKFKALNVDHYFFDLELHPKDEFGDYDFETPQALDLELINQHLIALSEGKEIKIPFYDFKEGKRYDNRTPFKLEENEILLIDSLHGLYPSMSKDIDMEKKFKLYLEPLLQMKTSKGQYVRWTDLRLMRRMLRDSVHRAYNPTQTLEHWHYVRGSELRNIIPYVNSTDYIISSGMPYELSIYKARLLKNFIEWEKNYKNNPLKADAYTRAARVLEVMSEIESVEDETAVPKDSVLREFIGGSILKY